MPSADQIAKAQELRSGKAWLWLYEIQLVTNTTEDRWVLLADHDQDVTFNGLTYKAYGIGHDKLSMRLDGSLVQLDLRISNVDGLAAKYLRAYDGLVGNRVVLRLVHEDLLANVADSYAFEFEIMQATATLTIAALTLGHLSMDAARWPAERFVRTNCRFKFVTDGRGRCGYSGSLTSCDRTLDGANGCVHHGNATRFGGFPSFPRAAA